MAAAFALVAIFDAELRVAAAVAALVAALISALLLTLETGAESSEELGSLIRIPIQPVRDLDARDVGVAPEADEALSGLGRTIENSYLIRDVDEHLDSELRSALEATKTPLIVLSGPSKAGKTRTLFEAMQRTMPDALLVAPKSFDSIDELIKPGVLPARKGKQLVFWLDDLEQFVRVEARGMREAVLDVLQKRKDRVVILATSGGKGMRIAGDSSRFSAPMEDLLSKAHQLRLDSELSKQELARLGVGMQEEAVERIEGEGIGAYMIAGRDLEEKLVNGSYPYGAPKSLHGQAIAYTVIDWHRCGIVDPIPREVLRDTYAHHLSESEDPSDDAFSTGLTWTRDPLYSTVALVTGREEFRAYDYVVSYVERSSGKQIDQQLWDQFLDAATEEQAFALARTANEAEVREPGEEWALEAEEALKQAATSSDDALRAAAWAELAFLLADRGEQRDARQAAGRAEEAGDENVRIELAHLLIEDGAEEVAMATLREADDAANPAAALNIGVLLFSQGDRKGAKAAFHRAEAGRLPDRDGWVNVLPYVKLLLDGDQKRAREAAVALKWGQKEGSPLAGVVLAHLYDQDGDREAALKTFQVSAEGGDFVAAMKRMGMLEALGRKEEAAEAMRLAREIREAEVRETENGS